MGYIEDLRKQYSQTPPKQSHIEVKKGFPFRKKAFGGKQSISKQGYVTIGGKEFFARSSWEANVGCYLEFLKQQGLIKDWEHEPETFWFDKIKRGVRSYKPDFKITNHDGTFYFEEVKGYMDKKSATKLKRMKIYHPQIKICVLDKTRYKALEAKCFIIPNWGKLL